MLLFDGVKMFQPDIFDYSNVLSNRLHNYAPSLKDYNGTSLFGYTRIFPNGRFIASSSDQQFNLRLIKFIALEKGALFYDSLLGKTQEYYSILWPKKSSHPSMSFFIENGYWNGITLMRFKETYVEHMWFCSNLENDRIKTSYTKNYKLMIEFSSYVLHRNEDLFNKANQCQFSDYLFDPLPDKNILESTLSAEQLKTKKFLDSILKPTVNLSKQEYHCVELLAQGRTVKRIARILNLEPSTVTTYIRNLKYKTECNSKDEVLDMFFDNRFSTGIIGSTHKLP